MNDTKTFEERVSDINADTTLNRKGRRMAIAQEKCAGTTARKRRQVEISKEQRRATKERVARQVAQAKARKAAIEKSNNPSKFTLIKRRIFAMQLERKRERARKYEQRMLRKNHAQ